MPTEPDYGYGNRYNSDQPKGLGYFGPLADGDGVRSEYSIGVNIGGKEVEIPSLVPTLTEDEVRSVMAMKDGDRMPHSVVQKAIAHATGRMQGGKDPFAATGEQLSNYPGIRRAPTPGSSLGSSTLEDLLIKRAVGQIGGK